MRQNGRLMLVGGLAAATLGYSYAPLQESSAAAITASPNEKGGNPTGTLQAIWTFEDGTPEDSSEFPTDGPRPSLQANPHPPIPSEMSISTDQALVGTKSLLSYLDGVNPESGDPFRRQLQVRIKPHPALPQGNTSGFAELGEYWLGWGMYIPSSHSVASTAYEIIMQSLWRTPSANAGDRNPMLAIESGEAIGGNFKTYGQVIETFQGDRFEANGVFSAELAPIVSGWSGFVQHIVWDYTGATGRYEVWMRNSATNGWQKYVDYSGPLGPNDGGETSGSFDLGWYKGWKSGEAGTIDPVTSRLMYIDEIKYALDDGNFDLVAPIEPTRRPAAPTLFRAEH